MLKEQRGVNFEIREQINAVEFEIVKLKSTPEAERSIKHLPVLTKQFQAAEKAKNNAHKAFIKQDNELDSFKSSIRAKISAMKI